MPKSRPRLKIIRRFGVQLPGLTRKSADKKPYPPGQHGQSQTKRRKTSEFRRLLEEKQKVRFNYGVSEGQIRRYLELARKMPGRTGDNLLAVLERRLDNVVFRMGFADTRNEARQLVRHGHFTINGKRVNIPSFSVKPGTAVEVAEKSRKMLRIQEALETVDRRGVPQWIEVDKKAMKGTVKSVPNREDLTMPIQEQLIVELYSK